MNISREEVHQARALVARVLSGEATPESDPGLFEEDVVLFNVRAVEAYDPEWLLEQLGDGRYPLSGRHAVLAEMRDLREAGSAILRRAENSGEA